MTRDPLRTDDLALTTYLSIEGYRHDRIEMKDRRSAEWVFSDGDPGLEQRIHVYQMGDAAVEPLRFSQELRRVRDELFRFLRSNGIRHTH